MIRHIWKFSDDRLSLIAQPGSFRVAKHAHDTGKAASGADAKGFIILLCAGRDCKVCLLPLATRQM